jgi:hypothetical protein
MCLPNIPKRIIASRAIFHNVGGLTINKSTYNAIYQILFLKHRGTENTKRICSPCLLCLCVSIILNSRDFLHEFFRVKIAIFSLINSTTHNVCFMVTIHHRDTESNKCKNKNRIDRIAFGCRIWIIYPYPAAEGDSVYPVFINLFSLCIRVSVVNSYVLC